MRDREQVRIKPKIRSQYKTYTPEQANSLRKLRQAEEQAVAAEANCQQQNEQDLLGEY